MYEYQHGTSGRFNTLNSDANSSLSRLQGRPAAGSYVDLPTMGGTNADPYLSSPLSPEFSGVPVPGANIGMGAGGAGATMSGFIGKLFKKPSQDGSLTGNGGMVTLTNGAITAQKLFGTGAEALLSNSSPQPLQVGIFEQPYVLMRILTLLFTSNKWKPSRTCTQN